ncbi:MAG: DUF58 domain-containing protein [Candidatus Bathyarchaeia archaeon]
MLSNILLRFFSAFSTLFLSGVFLGNLILIYLSLIPLLMMIFALTINQPRSVTVNRLERELASYVDNEVTVPLKIEVLDGVGLVTVADTLPQYFKLTNGNNFRVLWKGIRKKTQTISYKIECTKRGIYSLGPIKWEARHPLLLKQTRINTSEEPFKLIVRHKPLSVKRIRSAKTFSKIPLPLGSSAKMGITTTDFREIRDYLPGDPYRSINWKATARRAVQYGGLLPKVNEFEKEGKKVVWIFLDKSAEMSLGPIIRNPFEYAVQATAGLARFYLERDCKVGLCIYGARGAERIVFPDVGGRQYYRILRELVSVEVEIGDHVSIFSLKDAVRRCRGHLLGSNPLSIIITTITSRNFRYIIEGVKEIKKYTMPMKSKSRQTIILHLMAHHIAARDFVEEAAAELLELERQHIIEDFKKMGVSVIPWNPLRQSLTRLLLVGLRSA